MIHHPPLHGQGWIPSNTTWQLKKKSPQKTYLSSELYDLYLSISYISEDEAEQEKLCSRKADVMSFALACIYTWEGRISGIGGDF